MLPPPLHYTKLRSPLGPPRPRPRPPPRLDPSSLRRMMVAQHLDDLAQAQAIVDVDVELDLSPSRARRWVAAALFVLGAAAGGAAYARHLTAAPQPPVVAVGDATPRSTVVAPIPNAPVPNVAVQTPATAETAPPIRTKPTPATLKPRSLPRAPAKVAAVPTPGLDDPGF